MRTISFNQRSKCFSRAYVFLNPSTFINKCQELNVLSLRSEHFHAGCSLRDFQMFTPWWETGMCY